MVFRVEFLDVCFLQTLSMPSMLNHNSSLPETETMTTYTTVTTCPLTISSGSAYHTTLTTSTVVVTSCRGGCHTTTALPPPPKTSLIWTAPLPPPSGTAPLSEKTSSVWTAPLPPPLGTPPPTKPSNGTTVVVSSIASHPVTPIYSNVCGFSGK